MAAMGGDGDDDFDDYYDDLGDDEDDGEGEMNRRTILLCYNASDEW